MEKKEVKGKNYIVGYHTQEFRETGVLDEPKHCFRRDAWLGSGIYFWTDLDFAHYWGLDSKVNTSPTKKYDIYSAHIEYDCLLNSVFNEEHYHFFVETIEETIKKLKAVGVQNNLLHEKVNRYLVDNVWQKLGFKGIIFEDIPHNSVGKGRKYSDIPPLFYLKRIQLVAFDKKIIHNFVLLLEGLPNN